MADTVINPLANDPRRAGEGQRIFAATCQACHGVGAQGDRERGAPALTARGFKHGDGDGDIFRTIRTGVPGTQMPPYAALTDQQTWQLVAYIRSLQQAAAATGRAGRRDRRLRAATPPRVRRCSSGPRRTAPRATRSTAAAAWSGPTSRMRAGSMRR